jgi:predicted NBD/HSP70 family sugar kinase
MAQNTSHQVCAFDIGGTKIVFYLNPTRSFTHQYTNFADAKTFISTVLKSIPANSSVAISLAGIVRHSNTTASIYCPHISFAKKLLDFIRTKVANMYILNDADAFTYGQYILHTTNPKINTRIFTGVTIGTGIGAGIYHNGSFLLGEIGHQFTNTFRLEYYASGTGIHTQYALQTTKNYPAKKLFELHNSTSTSIIQTAQKEFAKALANVIHICGSTHIVFGGSVSEQESFIIDTIKQVPIYLIHPSLMPTTSFAVTGINSCAQGALAYVEDAIQNKKNKHTSDKLSIDSKYHITHNIQPVRTICLL